MRYGLEIPNCGEYADARLLATMAAEAEAAGWDGFFVWDHIATAASPFTQSTGRDPLIDPWIALTAIALRTEHIRIGPLVTPLPRRRPWKVARESVTLDQLSGSRLILGVGAGFPGIVADEFARFSEADDPRVRAARLDEGLEVLAGLWSGEPFHYNGAHYQIDETVFMPMPLQSPRIPVWVAGSWPRKAPFRRAARWDGVIPVRFDGPMMPDDVRGVLAYIGEYRASDVPFDLVIAGMTPDDADAAAAMIQPLTAAGTTWWIELIGPFRGSLAEMRARIRKGPLRTA
jgi:alkanesulfonate monooxygenase SsuD/methylene tetrahydromethanopterin reductase-like flavin-dependent oxidoreductase (luciferase family)